MGDQKKYMIEIVYGRGFLKSAQAIPKNELRKFASLLEELKRDPFYPKLHTKRLVGNLTGTLSFRITRDWRVIFMFIDPLTIQLLRVVHRKDAYR